MKKFLLPVMMMLSLNVMANEKGNGGGAYVCQDKDGKFTKALLEDFVEGKAIAKLDVENKRILEEEKLGETKEYVVSELVKFNRAFAAVVDSIYDDEDEMFGKSIYPLDLNLARTSNNAIAKVLNCAEGETSSFMSAARYEKYGMVVNQSIYDLMEEKHKLGLKIHEIIFKAARLLFNDEDSERSRVIVAGLFSTNGQRVLRQVLNDNFQWSFKTLSQSDVLVKIRILNNFIKLARPLENPASYFGVSPTSKKTTTCHTFSYVDSGEWVDESGHILTVGFHKGKFYSTIDVKKMITLSDDLVMWTEVKNDDEDGLYREVGICQI